MKNPILYIVLNKELKMSAGKAAAQAVHAAMMLENKYRTRFNSQYRRTVVILEASGRVQLDGIADYLSEANINYEYYVDEGANEVEAFSFTALAVEPIDANDIAKREIFESLNLFGSTSDEDKCCDVKSNIFLDAIHALHEIQLTFLHYDGMVPSDTSPRWLRKAIKKLGELK